MLIYEPKAHGALCCIIPMMLAFLPEPAFYYRSYAECIVT